MIYTGYFGAVKSYPKDKDYNFVSIARFDNFWKGEKFKKLAPPEEIIKIQDKSSYEKLYYELVLNQLNAKEIYNELKDNSVLLCYEKYDKCLKNIDFCHRHIVAKWFKKELNIEVKELIPIENKTTQLSFYDMLKNN